MKMNVRTIKIKIATKKIVLLIAIFINTYSLYSQNPQKSGIIIIKSEPQNASILIDGTHKEKTNYIFKNLQSGKHNIKVFFKNMKILNQYLTIDIDLKPNEKNIIFADFINNKISNNVKAINITDDSTMNNKPQKENKIFYAVEEIPEFPGGIKALRKYIATHIVYPEIAKKNGITGKVYVQFIINEKGKIEQVKVVRGVDPSIDKEAIRIIKNLPTWEPGKQGGKPVKVTFTLPINFPFN